MITPTKGRIVHYMPGEDEPFSGNAPLVGIITQVFSDSCVNLAIFEPDGNLMTDPPTSILLLQAGETPRGGRYCEWMPYQVKKDYGSESGERIAGTERIETGSVPTPSQPGETSEVAADPSSAAKQADPA